MFQFRFYLLSIVFCSFMLLGQGDVTTPKTILLPVDKAVSKNSTEATSTTAVPTTSSTTSTTTPPPTTTSSTPPTTTSSTPPTTTSTTPPTTTSSTTARTTTSSTTTSTTTTSTTEAPTTPAPAPTPAPGPLPPPDRALWSYTDNKTNITCVVVQFAAQLNVTYPKEDKSGSFGHRILNVPVNATVSGGNCSGIEQWINITWLATPATTNLTNLTLTFRKNDTTKEYALSSLTVALPLELFPNITSTKPLELSHGTEWHAPLSSSYRCTVPTQLNLTSDQINVVASLTFNRLQEEAFRTTSDVGFSSARECSTGDLPDAVPIAVGCALGGLVVVVLVAYLIGRRRSAQRGYLSM